MTIFEADRAQWRDRCGLMVDADAMNGTIHVGWALGSRPAHLLNDLTLDAEQVDLLESMLMNARLWLVKATRQRVDLEAAAQLADDDVQLCEFCGHIWHDKAVCDVCDCDLRRVWQLPRNQRPECRCAAGPGECPCTCADCLNFNPTRYYPIPTEITYGTPATETTEGTNR